jgi:hypothetical protein
MYAFAIMLVFTFTQIFMFNALPRTIKNYIAYYPMLAVGINIALSSFILTFAGIAYGAGMINLGSSLFFGVYVLWYKSSKGLYRSKNKFGISVIKSTNP